MSSNLFNQTVLELVNQQLVAAGLDSLAVNSQLNWAANLQTDEMTQTVSQENQQVDDFVSSPDNFDLGQEISDAEKKKNDDIERNPEISSDNDSVEENIVEEEISSDNDSVENIVEEEISSDNDSVENIVEEEISSDNDSVENIVEEEISSDNDSVENIVEEEISSDNDSVENIVEEEISSDNGSVENIVEEEISSGNGSVQSSTDVFDREIIDLVNQERAKVGADPLKINEQLDDAADLHSQDQAGMNNMTHTGSNGSTLGSRVNETGYEWSGLAENVSQVALDPETVMFGGTGVRGIGIVGWMDSPGHRSNILNPDLEEIGVGYAESSDGSPYWTQVFGADFA